MKTTAVSFLSIVCAGAMLAACADESKMNQSEAVPQKSDQLVLGTNVHKLPMRDPNASTITPAAAQTLTYFGGRVVSNLQVVQVLWGSGSYLSNVSGTGSPSIATFYHGVLNSP